MALLSILLIVAVIIIARQSVLIDKLLSEIPERSPMYWMAHPEKFKWNKGPIDMG